MLRCRVIALTTFGQDWRIQGGSVNNLVAQVRTQNLASEMLTFSSDRRKNILMPCSVQVDPQDDQVIITRCKEKNRCFLSCTPSISTAACDNKVDGEKLVVDFVVLLFLIFPIGMPNLYFSQTGSDSL